MKRSRNLQQIHVFNKHENWNVELNSYIRIKCDPDIWETFYKSAGTTVSPTKGPNILAICNF